MHPMRTKLFALQSCVRKTVFQNATLARRIRDATARSFWVADGVADGGTDGTADGRHFLGATSVVK